MKALLVVDVQNDFLPGGAIPVETGNRVIPVINDLMDKFSIVIATKDWHPKVHTSFSKELWPPHCIQDSYGSEFSPLLQKEKIQKVFYKGEKVECDSYSAFFDENKEASTGLDEYLKSHKIKTLYIAGLTAEYCVKFTALDAKTLDYEVYLVEDAVAFIDSDPGHIKNYLENMKLSDIKTILYKKI